jgi:hypothetical protein
VSSSLVSGGGSSDRRGGSGALSPSRVDPDVSPHPTRPDLPTASSDDHDDDNDEDDDDGGDESTTASGF